MTQEPEKQKDFFISYTGRDSTWAEWIAFELEAAGYTTVIQAWDSRPGMNFVGMMNAATQSTQRTIAVLSTAYLQSKFGFAEWAAAFRDDPASEEGHVVPVRTEEFHMKGLLGPIVYIDLVGLDEMKARETLLAGVKQGRLKPLSVAFPGDSSRQKSGQLMLERPSFPGSLPPIWNVPYPRNMLFTGREELLTQLAASLHTEHPTAISQPPKKDSQPQAISGLGGIGKTQVALEYAYRYRGEYQAVLWAQAETKESLTSSFITLATLLNLPEKNAQESAQVIEAMKRWLQRSTSYVLILDNADDLALAREYLPPMCSGQVLLTTRAQSTGRFAQRLEVEVLPIEQGVEFLLRRAGLLSVDATLEQATEQDRHVAQEVCKELGGLPLALDQTGAYIEETQSSLVDYLTLYKTQRVKVLRERGGLVPDHPLPVATTWSLSFQHVEQQNSTAADILRLCAFLAPDAIPENILTTGDEQLGPRLQGLADKPIAFNKAIAVLGAYSLVKRDAGTHMLSLHRLVQAVLKDQMKEENQKQWAERTIRGIHAILPPVKHEEWSRWEQLVSHILMCTKLIEEYTFAFTEGTQLLQQTGWYLTERARYSEAEPLLLQALIISEREQGPEHEDTARNALTLANLYQDQGKYTEAEPLLERALAIYEQQLGAMHPETATSLNNLAGLYKDQRKYTEAEPLYQRALAIREEQLGAMHPDTAGSLHNLATLYDQQGKYVQAEPLYKRALAIFEQQLGEEHPNTKVVRGYYTTLLQKMEKSERTGEDGDYIMVE